MNFGVLVKFKPRALELKTIPFRCELIIYLSGSDNPKWMFHIENFLIEKLSFLDQKNEIITSFSIQSLKILWKWKAAYQCWRKFSEKWQKLINIERSLVWFIFADVSITGSWWVRSVFKTPTPNNAGEPNLIVAKWYQPISTVENFLHGKFIGNRMFNFCPLADILT